MKNQKTKKILSITIPLLLSLILFSPFWCLAECTSIEISGIDGKISINYLDHILNCVGIINILGYAVIYFIISVFSLIIGCLIIKQKAIIKSCKFLRYILFTTIAGLLIAAGVLIGPLFSDNILVILLIFLIFYNYWLSRKILNLSIKQAIYMGTIMGIFPNICLFYLIFRILPVIE